MTPEQIFQTLMTLQSQVASLDTKVNWLIMGILGLMFTVVVNSWDNHKLKKAQIKFLEGKG